MIPISPLRRLLVSLGLAGMCVATAYEMVVRGEHWPFSHYPMFSWIRHRPEVDHMAFEAVPADGSPPFLLHRREHTHPYFWTKHKQAFRGLFYGRGDKARNIEVALADDFARYERGRLSGRHDGPPLAALRMHHVWYKLDDDAEGFIDEVFREQVAEVTADDDVVRERLTIDLDTGRPTIGGGPDDAP